MRPLGWVLIQSDGCPCKEGRPGHRHAKGPAHDDRGRRQLPACLGERPQEGLARPTPQSQTSSPPGPGENMSFKLPDGCTRLQQPWPTHVIPTLILMAK